MPPLPLFHSETLVSELRTTEMFLITALRLSARGAAQADWRDGFRAAGIHNSAVPCFEALFSIVGIAARRCLDIRQVDCPILGLDEVRLIQLMNHLQQDQTNQAFAILSDWLFPTAARMAMEPAKGLADALASAGLYIPMRQAGNPHAYEQGTHPGLALLH